MARNATAMVVLLGLTASVTAVHAQTDKPGFRDTPYLPGGQWRVHDADRPAPPTIAPGATVGAPPADAVVLFDGTNADAWVATGAPWVVKDGALTVPPRVGGRDSTLISKDSFGDVQFHLEFRMPPPGTFSSQDRGNSGVWFMQRYEVQILDAYDNPTYADGTVGAIYGQRPPLVIAPRKPGEWQSYDVIFERPRFDDTGRLVRPAYVTVHINGVLVQNRQPFLGTTIWKQVARYVPHSDAAPIQLQDHDSAVSFRNIWVRRLPEAALSHDEGEKK